VKLNKNDLTVKAVNRFVRSQRKMLSLSRINSGPVVVSKSVAKNHAYLRDHGLPHSESVAALMPNPPSPLTLGQILVMAFMAAALAKAATH
jgi:hypothetical protein